MDLRGWSSLGSGFTDLYNERFLSTLRNGDRYGAMERPSVTLMENSAHMTVKKSRWSKASDGFHAASVNIHPKSFCPSLGGA